GAIAKLKVEGKNIEMYGSADLMQTLIEHDLIDEYRIWVHPIVIGGGERPFTHRGRATQPRPAGNKTPHTRAGRLASTPPHETRVYAEAASARTRRPVAALVRELRLNSAVRATRRPATRRSRWGSPGTPPPG